MKNEQKLKEALKLINDKCKEPNLYDILESQSLPKRIETIQSLTLRYIDTETINYQKTNLVKNDLERAKYLEYRPVELTKKQVEDSIQYMQWLIRDLESCISHLK